MCPDYSHAEKGTRGVESMKHPMATLQNTRYENNHFIFVYAKSGLYTRFCGIYPF